MPSDSPPRVVADEALAVLDEMTASDPLMLPATPSPGSVSSASSATPTRPDRFAAAKAIDPAIPQIDLQLGMALFLSEDIDAAEQSFAAARAAGTTVRDRLLRGSDRALAQHLPPAPRRSARRPRSPNTLDPAASYYAGLAWRSAQDEERARAALSA